MGETGAEYVELDDKQEDECLGTTGEMRAEDGVVPAQEDCDCDENLDLV